VTKINLFKTVSAVKAAIALLQPLNPLPLPPSAGPGPISVSVRRGGVTRRAGDPPQRKAYEAGRNRKIWKERPREKRIDPSPG